MTVVYTDIIFCLYSACLRLFVTVVCNLLVYCMVGKSFLIYVFSSSSSYGVSSPLRCPPNEIYWAMTGVGCHGHTGILQIPKRHSLPSSRCFLPPTIVTAMATGELRYLSNRFGFRRMYLLVCRTCFTSQRYSRSKGFMMTKRSSFYTFFLRAAVLELLVDDLEPHVEHFECVEHPKRLSRPDR